MIFALYGTEDTKINTDSTLKEFTFSLDRKDNSS